MTMSDNIGEHSAVCPLVADESDVGMEAPAKGLAPKKHSCPLKTRETTYIQHTYNKTYNIQTYIQNIPHTYNITKF